MAEKLNDSCHDVKVMVGENARGETLDNFVQFRDALIDIGAAVLGDQNGLMVRRVNWAIERIVNSRESYWSCVAYQERVMVRNTYANISGKGDVKMKKILLAVDDHLDDETCDPQGTVPLKNVFADVASEIGADFVGLTSTSEALDYFANDATLAEASRVGCLFLDVKFDGEGETAGSELGKALSKYNIPIVFLTSKGMREAQIGYVANRFYYQSKDSLYEEREDLAKITQALMTDCFNDGWTMKYTDGKREVHLEGRNLRIIFRCCGNRIPKSTRPRIGIRSCRN